MTGKPPMARYRHPAMAGPVCLYDAQEDNGRRRMKDALVSVVIATHNRATLLEQALGSLLEQTYRPLELVVVDDGSTDDTYDRVAALARQQCQAGVTIRYQRQANGGPAVARNRGMEASHGDHVLFMDDDDLMAKEAVEHLVAALGKRHDAALGYASYASSDAEGRPLPPLQHPHPPRSHPELLARMISGSWFVPIHGNLFTREALRRVGPWNAQLTSQEDDEYMLRAILQDVSFVSAPRARVYYRQHTGTRRSQPGATGSWDEQGQTQRLKSDLAIRTLAYRTLAARGELSTYREAFVAWHRRLRERYRPLLDKCDLGAHPLLAWLQPTQAEAAAVTPAPADTATERTSERLSGPAAPWPPEGPIPA